MARARINKRITALVGQCDGLAKSGELNQEQVAFVNQLIAWVSPLAAGCQPNSFRILGLEPTAYWPDIEHAAEHRLEMLDPNRLIALDLARFPPVVALARVLEEKMRLHLKALKDHHRSGTLVAYAQYCRRRRTGVLAELMSRSTASSGVQADAQQMRPRGGLGKWD